MSGTQRIHYGISGFKAYDNPEWVSTATTGDRDNALKGSDLSEMTVWATTPGQHSGSAKYRLKCEGKLVKK